MFHQQILARQFSLLAFFIIRVQLQLQYYLVRYYNHVASIEELAAAKKKDDNTAKRRAALHKRVHAVESRTKNSAEWTTAELGTMLVYHKNKTDPKVASTLEGMRTQWLERKNRTVERLLTTDQINVVLGTQLDEKKDRGVKSGFI